MKPRLSVNKELCLNCRNCELMCSLGHEKVINPAKARIHVVGDEKTADFEPIICHQCARPLCKEACPVDAFVWDPELEIYYIDEDECIGCSACARACPFDAIRMDPDSGLALKCDLCGGDPECIKQCRVLEHVGQRALNYSE